jgi:hypothetical protein
MPESRGVGIPCGLVLAFTLVIITIAVMLKTLTKQINGSQCFTVHNLVISFISKKTLSSKIKKHNEQAKIYRTHTSYKVIMVVPEKATF